MSSRRRTGRGPHCRQRRYGPRISTSSWVLLVVGWVAGWLLLWRLPALRPARRSVPEVAVVVPARDEAGSLPLLLDDLAGQTAPAAELVVVDDGSTDATAAVAEAGGARVVSGAALPAGWAGKPWACWQGAKATSAPLVVFLDADVRLGSGALAALAETVSEVGGLVSIVPEHRVGRLVEHLSLVPNVVSIMGSGAAQVRPARAPAPFGPCLVTSRRDYEAVGGHDRVAAAVLEDLELGRAYAGSGRPVIVLGGGDLVGYRMYPGGLGPLVEGWTKNMAGGARRIPAWRTLATAIWVAGSLSGTLALVEAPLGVAAYLGVAAQVEVLGRRVGRFRRGVGLFHPLLLSAFVALFALAVLKAVRGRARWKGRVVALRA